MTAARPDLLEADGALVDQVVAIVLEHAHTLVADRSGTLDAIVARYGMSTADTSAWLAAIEWAESVGIDLVALESARHTMVELGRIDATLSLEGWR